MTELYHGPWDPITGDRPKRKVPDDPYHPRYPDATGVRVKAENGRPVGVEQKVAQPK